MYPLSAALYGRAFVRCKLISHSIDKRNLSALGAVIKQLAGRIQTAVLVSLNGCYLPRRVRADLRTGRQQISAAQCLSGPHTVFPHGLPGAMPLRVTAPLKHPQAAAAALKLIIQLRWYSDSLRLARLALSNVHTAAQLVSANRQGIIDTQPTSQAEPHNAPIGRGHSRQYNGQSLSINIRCYAHFCGHPSPG